MNLDLNTLTTPELCDSAIDVVKAQIVAIKEDLEWSQGRLAFWQTARGEMASQVTKANAWGTPEITKTMNGIYERIQHFENSIKTLIMGINGGNTLIAVITERKQNLIAKMN